MEEFKNKINSITGECLLECPHRVVGKSGGVIWVGSVTCKERCKFFGKIVGTTIQCNFLDDSIPKTIYYK